MKINLLVIIFCLSFLFLFFSCKKLVQFGEKPKDLQEDILFEKGKVYFKEERLEARYAITKEFVKENSRNSIIFFFHGLNKTELEWVSKNGFGKTYYDVLRNNPDYKSFPVVSISLGRSFLFLKYVPAPFDADIESLFINKIIPYFRDKLNANGKIYLIGHSMGGFNALSLSLRNPEKFPVIAVISPYVAPISPFTNEFDEMGEKLKMSKLQAKILKNTLTKAFQTEEQWYKYNPFKLIEKNDKFPYIIISAATNDLPGFEDAIKYFARSLTENKIDHHFCNITGDHNTTCKLLFSKFLEYISAE